jgi:uncharacterized membrane protein
MTDRNRETSRPPATTRGARIDFIDLLRGWAVVVMIETHVVNATLAADVMGGSFFQYLKFINGLVAPSFLFASGLSYAVATRRKAQEYLSFGKPLFKQLWRIVSIALIGYLLHVPIFSARRLFTEATDEQWQSFFQVDVLQCIAISLLVLQGFLLVLRSQPRLYLVTLAASITIIIVTPFVWETDFWSILPWPVAGYLNGIRYSLFPIFPWTAFLFAGAVTGHFFLEARDRNARRSDQQGDTPFYRSLLWSGGSLVLLSYLIDIAFPGLRTRDDYWVISPAFVCLRLGIVMLLCAGAGFWTHTVHPKGRPFMLLFGRESLLVYVTHLLLLYGNFGSFNLTREVGRGFGYLEALLLTVFLVALMYGTSVLWSRTKATSPRLKHFAIVSTIAAVALTFLFGEG